MNLDDWLCRIRDLHDKDIDMGLARISEVADIMRLRHLSAKVVLIAGTNGKGTTSRFIEAYLLSLGLKVGLFNSPALINYTETVRINGEALTDIEHTKAFDAIWHARGDVVLTEFEFSTLAALYLFAQSDLDVVLIEVGMGGRLDSTNVVEPDVSVLTTVALDHMGFLGDTREAIGFEKAGIFRAGKPAIVGELDIPQSVFEQADRIGAQMMCVNQHFSYQLDDLCPQTWRFEADDCTLSKLSLPNIPMQNVATALASLSHLDVPMHSANVNDVLANLTVEGRFETIFNEPQVIVDVAHNTQAIEHMVKKVEALVHKGSIHARPVYAVVGMLKDKDIDGAISIVKSIVDKFYLCQLDTPRGASKDQLVTSLEKHYCGPYSCYSDVASGFSAAIDEVTSLQQQPLSEPKNKPQNRQQQPQAPLIIVFGSFYTVAGAKQYVKSISK